MKSLFFITCLFCFLQASAQDESKPCTRFYPGVEAYVPGADTSGIPLSAIKNGFAVALKQEGVKLVGYCVSYVDVASGNGAQYYSVCEKEIPLSKEKHTAFLEHISNAKSISIDRIYIKKGRGVYCVSPLIYRVKQ
jgi:hypothetical protein